MSENEEGGGIREPERDVRGYIIQISACTQQVTTEWFFLVTHRLINIIAIAMYN